MAWYAASAVLAFLFAMRKPLSGAIAGIGGAVASAMLVVAGGAALLMPEHGAGHRAADPGNGAAERFAHGKQKGQYGAGGIPRHRLIH